MSALRESRSSAKWVKRATLITDGLFVGDMMVSKDVGFLRANKISAIYVVGNSPPDSKDCPPDVDVFSIPWKDDDPSHKENSEILIEGLSLLRKRLLKSRGTLLAYTTASTQACQTVLALFLHGSLSCPLASLPAYLSHKFPSHSPHSPSSLFPLPSNLLGIIDARKEEIIVKDYNRGTALINCMYNSRGYMGAKEFGRSKSLPSSKETPREDTGTKDRVQWRDTIIQRESANQCSGGYLNKAKIALLQGSEKSKQQPSLKSCLKIKSIRTTSPTKLPTMQHEIFHSPQQIRISSPVTTSPNSPEKIRPFSLNASRNRQLSPSRPIIGKPPILDSSEISKPKCKPLTPVTPSPPAQTLLNKSIRISSPSRGVNRQANKSPIIGGSKLENKYRAGIRAINYNLLEINKETASSPSTPSPSHADRVGSMIEERFQAKESFTVLLASKIRTVPLAVGADIYSPPLRPTKAPLPIKIILSKK